jgi:dihydrofolate reductase
VTVSLVAARALNNIIGNGPDIPWQVKGEQKLFREITIGGILIMAAKPMSRSADRYPVDGRLL